MSKGKIGVWIFVALMLIIALAAVGLFLVLPKIILAEVEKQAAEAGVELKDCELGFSLTELNLKACSFKLIDDPQVEGNLKQVEVQMAGLEPQRIDVTGAQVRLLRIPNLPPTEQLNQLLNLRQKHRSTIAVPWSVRQSRLDWFLRGDAKPLVSLTDMTFDSKGDSFKSKLLVGEWLDGTLEHAGSRTQVNIRWLEHPDVTTNVVIENQDKDFAELHLDVQKLPAGELMEPVLGLVPAPIKDVTLSGQLLAKVPLGLSKEGITGDFRFTLSHLSLPVPPALGGLVQRDAGQVSARYRVTPNNMTLKLKDLEVVSGVLHMKGDASAKAEGLGAPFGARLHGALSCGSIVQAATRARTDSPIALAAARIVKRALKGSVGISLTATGNLPNPLSWKVKRGITAGCGLKDELTEAIGLTTGILDALPSLGLPTPGADLKPPNLKETLEKLPKLTLPQLPGLGKGVLDPPPPATSHHPPSPAPSAAPTSASKKSK